MAPRKRKNQAAAAEPAPAVPTSTAYTRSARRNNRNVQPDIVTVRIAAPTKRGRGRPRKNPIVIPVDPLSDNSASVQSESEETEPEVEISSFSAIGGLSGENEVEIVNLEDSYEDDSVVECVTEEIVADDVDNDNNDTNDSSPGGNKQSEGDAEEIPLDSGKPAVFEENIKNIQEFMKEQDDLQSTEANELVANPTFDENAIANTEIIAEEKITEIELENVENIENDINSDCNLDNPDLHLNKFDSGKNVDNKFKNIDENSINSELDNIKMYCKDNYEINATHSSLNPQTDAEMMESGIEPENNEIIIESEAKLKPVPENTEVITNFELERSESDLKPENCENIEMTVENTETIANSSNHDENSDDLNEKIENLTINNQNIENSNDKYENQQEIDAQPIETEPEPKIDESNFTSSNCEPMEVVETTLIDCDPENPTDMKEIVEKTEEVKDRESKSQTFEDAFTKALKNLDTSLEDTKNKSKSKKKSNIKEIKLKTKEAKPKEKAKSSKLKKEPKIRTITLKTKAERKEYKPSKKLEKTEEESAEEKAIRRSSRIKSIKKVQKRSTGHGLVRSKSESVLDSSNADFVDEKSGNESEKLSKAPFKSVKSCESIIQASEAELAKETPTPEMMADLKAKLLEEKKEIEKRLKQFVHLKDNLYLTDRQACKEAKKMVCDCFLTDEEIERKELGCGDDCLNRLLMIECGNYCPVGDRCTNKRFQKVQFAPVEVFKTEKKGLGLRAAANIPYGEFILEYVGEVLDPEEFEKRAEIYSSDKNIHYYFMSLRADAIIDATMKGNISRFINHSCDPNAETQKWTVNGELRIGFFSTRTILAGEEITFDYRFQRYGKEAQKCYCGSSLCRGWLGEEPESDEEEEEGEEDEEEAEETESDKSKAKALGKVDKDVKKPVVKVKTPKKRSERKKPTRKEKMFEDLDQLDGEIDILNVTGLKNQAHTLKLCRLMVLAKEPSHRLKLVNILRRGELPCRRLFLDYHGLRLMHGYMVDAANDEKCANLRLEILQTLASLPIPNKTMLQDSKVLPTVESWSINKDLNVSPLDSESCSPKNTVSSTSEETCVKNEESSPKIETLPISQPEEQISQKIEDGMQLDDSSTKVEDSKDLTSPKNEDLMEIDENSVKESIDTDVKPNLDQEVVKLEPIDNLQKTEDNLLVKMDEDSQKSEDKPVVAEQKNDENLSPKVEVSSTSTIIDDKKEEIMALCLKLLDDWKNLKEVFRIPKKERIEQMKEHEREANRKYMASGYNAEVEMIEKKFDRYRLGLGKYKASQQESGRDKHHRKGGSYGFDQHDRHNPFNKMSKHERRKIFALQFELKEEERRMKQREMWRQHERNCMMLGTDPRLTAPFDPNRGFQCIWNPQLGQWQNVPFPSDAGALPPPPGHKYAPPGPYMLPPPPMALPPPLPHHHALHYGAPYKIVEEDPSQVKFMGPIPAPIKLPPKWKMAKDKYGRPYYYHIKIRISQWEPPPFTIPPVTVKHVTEELSETESSSDTSSLSSSSSSENSDSDDDVDDTKLLLEVRRRMEKSSKSSGANKLKEKQDTHNEELDLDSIALPESAPADEVEETVAESSGETVLDTPKETEGEEKPPPSKKRRAGLCTEIIISPRTEEDRLQFREDLKRYKENKEMLKREKELTLRQKKRASTSAAEGEVEKKPKEKRTKNNFKSQIKEMTDGNSETARRIKETFRSNMATVVVGVLNYYRKPDCKEGRITNTEDFKHLARKLTHFVMLKEIKHISKIEDLTCTENVKSKARDYIKKYMSKFGDVYQKRNDEPDFKD